MNNEHTSSFHRYSNPCRKKDELLNSNILIIGFNNDPAVLVEHIFKLFTQEDTGVYTIKTPIFKKKIFMRVKSIKWKEGVQNQHKIECLN